MKSTKFYRNLAVAAAIIVAAVLFLKGKTPIEPEKSPGGQQKISLNGQWDLSFAKQPHDAARTPSEFKALNAITTIPASVPGNAEIDLYNAKLISNPLVGDNVYQLRKFEGLQWMYSREFNSPELKDGQRAILNLKGVDTLADVFLNGKLVGSPENMFIEHKYDITGLLNKVETNRIEIILRSVPVESSKFDQIFGGSLIERMHIRKAPASFGWDIHPRIVSVGLWRDAEIEIRNPVHIEDVHWYTRSVNPKNGSAHAYANVKLNMPFDMADSLSIVLTISKDGKTLLQKKSPVLSYANLINFYIDKISLWWPRGYGDPALYDAKIEIVDKDGKSLASDSRKFGFRTVRLDFKELELPETAQDTFGNGNVSISEGKDKVKGEFRFYVNDVPIFMQGTNWVPLDASHSRDKEHLEKAMEMIVDLNCNMIRCWGGNVYEDSDFYDLCDKYGVMVWQDFSMGCSVYPQDSDFAKKIEEEVKSVVHKFRSHPSLALWAGNNENDQAYTWRGKEFKITPQHDRISRFTIPNTIFEYDWTRPYLPSSPYLTELSIKNPKKYAAPEVHLWGPRGYYKDPFYKDAIAVFVSEIGYHGAPNRSSLEKMMEKDFVYPWTKDGKWNKQWQAKAVMPYPNADILAQRNNLMTKQVKILFGEVPQELDDFIFASQVVQAEAKKYFIEMWRSQMFRPKTGILWWNLRDAWPILSDAIVDYYNSKKLAYYYIKRVQTNVCAMINDDFKVIAANATPKDANIKISVTDVDSGKELMSKEYTVPANSSSDIGKIPEQTGQGMLLIKYSVDGKEDQINHYMYGKPPFKLSNYKKWFKELEIKREM